MSSHTCPGPSDSPDQTQCCGTNCCLASDLCCSGICIPHDTVIDKGIICCDTDPKKFCSRDEQCYDVGCCSHTLYCIDTCCQEGDCCNGTCCPEDASLCCDGACHRDCCDGTPCDGTCCVINDESVCCPQAEGSPPSCCCDGSGCWCC